MGVALYIQGHIKVPDCIVGKVSLLGCYEVNYSKIDQHKVEGSSAVLHSCLPSLDEVSGSFYNYGFKSAAELSFFHNASNPDAYKEENGIEFCIMYAPDVVLAAVTKVLKLNDLLARYVEFGDKEDLLELEKIGKLVAESDGILKIGFG